MVCPRVFCALCSIVGAVLATQECRNSGSSLKEVLADDDLPLSLLQVTAIQTRNARAHLQNETENSTVEAALVVPSHRVEGAPKKFDAAIGQYMSVTFSNKFQAFVCTFSLCCFAFILVLNIWLVCAQTQHQGRRKAQTVSKMQKPVDHLIVTSKQDLASPDTVKQKLQTYTRGNLGGEQIKGAGVFKGSKNYLRAPSEDVQPEYQKGKTLKDKSDLKQALPFKVLDPRLVLPLRETWYAVTIEEVFEADGSFEILRITGFPQLRASIVHNHEKHGRMLELFCSGGSPSAKKQLVARAFSRNASTSELLASEKLEVNQLPLSITLVDKKDVSLGELRPVASDRFELLYQDQVALTLALDNAGQLHLTSACGSSLACASILAGHLGICVNAGADTGLAITLTLAVVLFAGGKASLWGAGEVREAPACEEEQEQPSSQELQESTRKNSVPIADLSARVDDD